MRDRGYQIPDDRRYMNFETRAIEDARYRGKINKTTKPVETCYCGKTVIKTHGRPTGYTCPRNCDPGNSDQG